ncbi:ABC transporter substrate-binding protein [Microbaculum sp. FT89]|uniref:ABC transporter substrate-binding protein n=1 Tax=Microbaculum sp. FT89 TaxID=3447298 RepID=UPI003F533B76
MSYSSIAGASLSRRRFLQMTAAAGAAGFAPSVAFAEEMKVHAAIGVDMWYITYMVAQEKGIWKRHGLDATITHFDNGAVALDALATGNADIGSATNMSMMQRVSRGAKMFAVSSMAASGKLFSVVSSEDLKTPKDLIGKKLGLSKDGVLEFLYKQFATNNGIGLEEIELVNIAPPEAVAALSRNDVDAIMFWEPWPSRVLELVPGTHTLRQLSDDGIAVTNWLFMGEDLINDKPRAEATLAALIEASEFVLDNKDEVVEIGARRLQTDPENIRFQYDNIDYEMVFPADRYTFDFDELAAFNLEKGLLKTVPTLAEVARPEFMLAVAPDRAPGW